MKKGFTLIELLAVIVILAIIAVIATPIVISIINDSKESSHSSSAEFYLDAVEYAIANATVNNEKATDGIYNIMHDGNLCYGAATENGCNGQVLNVEVKGNKPSSGSFYIKDGQISRIYYLKIENSMFSTDVNSKKLISVKNMTSKWDGKSATKLENLEIDEENKIVYVKSAADLAGVRNIINTGGLVGYNITLKTNIDLNNHLWTAIGVGSPTSYGTHFRGTFDGNEYIISGLNVKGTETSGRDIGFFGMVSGEVVIKNLNLFGSVTSAADTAGGLVSFVSPGESGTSNITVENCNINVDVSSGDTVGGIIARAYHAGTTKIINTVNNGNIAVVNKLEGEAGKSAGFIAVVSQNTNGTFIIENSVNNGNITGGTYTGGYLGFVGSGNYNNVIKNSINNGNIKSDSIASGFVSLIQTETPVGIMENCVNNGNITGQDRAAGFFASLLTKWTLNNNTNNGQITSNGVSGGIISVAKRTATIENCKNTAAVSANEISGGILGQIYIEHRYPYYDNKYEIIIRNCNGGTESITATKVGRILGNRYKETEYFTVNIIIENSPNNGESDIPVEG